MTGALSVWRRWSEDERREQQKTDVNFRAVILQGEAVNNNDPLFTELLQGRAGYNQVMEEYRQIVNCRDYLTRAAAIEAIQVKMIDYFDADDMKAFRQLDMLLSEKLGS